MMEIQCLDRQQLAAFIASDTFRQLPNLPISAHRAMSQILNPRAEPTDPLLILAWLEGELVGYLGVLPDRYFRADGQPVRCGWLSCLWVSDQHRGKSIAKHLVTKGAESMDGQIVLTEFTPTAKQLYDRLGLFADLRISIGIRLYYRLELNRLLPPKRPFFGKIRPFLKAVDAIGNVLTDGLAWFRRPTGLTQWSYTTSISPEIRHFIAERQGCELFRRNEPELQWALQNPWLLSGPPDEMSRRYYFSSMDASFESVCLQVCDAEKRLQAFLILTRRNRTMKMPCCYLAEGVEPLVAAAVQWHIHHWGINTFSTFHPEMVQYYQTNRTFALYKKPLKRHYLATKRLVESLAGYHFELQDGDGDCFFT